MKFDKNALSLYAVTDRSWLGDDTLINQVEKALIGGVTFLQLREKNLSKEEFIEVAKECKILCKKYNVPFVINDDVEVAKIVGADGVHVGQKDLACSTAREILGEDAIIGVTARTVEQAKTAEKNGADYLGVGAVFGSSTKTDAVPLGINSLNEICRSVSIPVVAIGGINITNISKLQGAEIAGAAVISGIFGAEDITKAAYDLKQEVKKIIER